MRVRCWPACGKLPSASPWVADLLGVEPEVVGVAEHVLEDGGEIPLSLPARVSASSEPEGAEAEGSFLARQAVRRLPVVAVDEAVGDEAPILRGAVDGIERLEHPGVAGRKEKTRARVRFEASRVSSP